jgi:hypothetical protein
LSSKNDLATRPPFQTARLAHLNLAEGPSDGPLFERKRIAPHVLILPHLPPFVKKPATPGPGTEDPVDVWRIGGHRSIKTDGDVGGLSNGPRPPRTFAFEHSTRSSTQWLNFFLDFAGDLSSLAKTSFIM